jgi:hypothetical protein
MKPGGATLRFPLTSVHLPVPSMRAAKHPIKEAGPLCQGVPAMSLFYILPPRSALADRLARILQPLLPGIDWDSRTRLGLADVFGGAAAAHPNVYVVYREDLPAGEPAHLALANGFGAESGDEVIEVRLGARPDDWSSSRWRIL